MAEVMRSFFKDCSVIARRRKEAPSSFRVDLLGRTVLGVQDIASSKLASFQSLQAETLSPYEIREKTLLQEFMKEVSPRMPANASKNDSFKNDMIVAISMTRSEYVVMSRVLRQFYLSSMEQDHFRGDPDSMKLNKNRAQSALVVMRDFESSWEKASGEKNGAYNDFLFQQGLVRRRRIDCLDGVVTVA